jgi:hypothetical protein
MKTIYLNDTLINIGDWDFNITTDLEGNKIIGNPLPEGAIEKDEEVVTNEDGSRSVVVSTLAQESVDYSQQQEQVD